MATDWNNIKYQQLLDLAKQQNPSLAKGYQQVSLGNQGGNDVNSSAIDLSSLGLTGSWSATQTPDQGLVFAGNDPNAPGKFVAVRSGDHPGIDSSKLGGSFGGAGGLNVTGVSKGDTFLDKAIPLIVAGGAGAVGLNALGLLGGAAGGSAAGGVGNALAGVAGEAAAPVAVGDLGLGAAGAAGGGAGSTLAGSALAAGEAAIPTVTITGAAGGAGGVGLGSVGAAGTALAGTAAAAGGSSPYANETNKFNQQGQNNPNLGQVGGKSVDTTGGSFIDKLTGKATDYLTNKGVGAVANSIFGGSGGSVGSGLLQLAGGGISAANAQKYADEVKNTANPYGNYMPQAAQTLAAQGQTGTYANPGSSSGLGSTWGLGNFLNNTTQPLTGELSGAGTALSKLIADPSSIYDTAQYKAAFGQGQNAVNSTLAAQGLNASGNQLAALQNYGQSFGQKAYSDQVTQLSGLYSQELGANQQAFNQGLSLNNQAYSQGAQMSGLAGANLGAAAQAQSNVYGNIAAGGNAIAQGAGSILNGLGGVGGIADTIGSIGDTISGWFNGGSSGSSGGIDLFSGAGSLFT